METNALPHDINQLKASRGISSEGPDLCFGLIFYDLGRLAMNFRNHTCYPAIAYEGITPKGASFHVVALRQSFSFNNGALTFADKQTPLRETDLFAGEPNQSSLLAESDFCPFKPKCDLLVKATAHAPGSRPTRSFLVGLKVWRPETPGRPFLDKALQVSGPSTFRRRWFPFRLFWFFLKVGTLGLIRRSPWKRTRPAKFLSLPIRYEHSYGGEAKVLISDREATRVRKRNLLPGVDRKALKANYKSTGEKAALAWEVHQPNPIGQGWATLWHLRVTRNRPRPAPRIEAPDCPVTANDFIRVATGKMDPSKQPPLLPQGFGPLAKTWLPRRHLAGTVDGPWIQSGLPFPEDFAFGFWNAAPEDQQLIQPEGDEVLELTNLCEPGTPGAKVDSEGNNILSLQLPGHMPYVLIRYRDGGITSLPLFLDTIQLDAEERSVELVWRMVLPLEPRAVRVLETRFVTRENREAWIRRGGPELLRLRLSESILPDLGESGPPSSGI